MLHTKFLENRPAGSGEDFFRIFTIYGRGGHFGHVTSIMSSDFHFLVPKSFHIKFGSGRNSSFCFLGPSARKMTLTFRTHIPSYVQLDICFY